MKGIKKLARKIAALIVTYYYNRIYKKAVAEADRRHKEEGGMMYVVDHFVKGQTLSIIDRAGFRKMKHDAQRTNKLAPNWLQYFSPEYNTQLIKDGSWYHTADRSENNGLSKVDIEARKTVFVKIGLQRAKLLD